MTAITTPQKKERFRTVPAQNFFGIPKGVCVAHLSMVGYLQGERVNKKVRVELDCFDTISFLCWSVNDNNGNRFIHALGRRNDNDSSTVLVLEYRL